jgi:PPOX class probable F420-dependent enzyme
MAFELTEQIEKHLTDDEIIRLTTVTPSGRPAPRPVWFSWDDAVITIYTEPDGAKVRHLAANDQVTVNFNSTPFGTDVVVISGRAELVPDSPPPTRVPGLMEKYSARIEQMGYTLEWFDSYSLAIRVTPERAWTI